MELNKILSGKIILDFRQLKIVIEAPSALDRYEAEIFAAAQYDEAFLSGLMTDSEMLEYMLENKRWSKSQQEQLEKLPKEVEELKQDYYKSFYNKKRSDFIRTAITKSLSLYKKLTGERYRLFDKTCEGIQTISYSKFLLEKFIPENTLSVHKVYEKYMQSVLTHDEVRAVSKDDKWRSIWSVSKDSYGLFGVPASQMTEMQISLVNWSKIYDSVYESMEKPSQAIIDDDYALDGWFVTQHKNRKDEDKKKDGETYAKGMKDGEVMVMIADTPQEALTADDEAARRIHDMNTREAKAHVRNRFSELNQRGSLNEMEFGYVQRELAMQQQRSRKK